MHPNIDQVTQLLHDAAEQEILPRFCALAADEIEEKNPGNLVTIADRAAEAFITRGLLALMPDSLVVGEEAVFADRRILEHIKGARPVWTVDPIDGTANFVAGKPSFAVMVAYVTGGQARIAWIYDPIRKLTAIAQEGGGAWIDGQRARLASAVRPELMSGALGYGHRRQARRRHLKFGYLTQSRCCGQDYLAMLEGRMHFALYGRPLPWDHTPGTLLHREAGGWNARLDDGCPYDPADSRGHLLMAPDKASWTALHDLFA